MEGVTDILLKIMDNDKLNDDESIGKEIIPLEDIFMK
jgi:hypothetical protein